MSNRLKVYCKNIEQYVDINGGETLLEIAKMVNLDFEPICARVNNKTENLYFPVFTPKQVEFLSKESSSGNRCYIRSLCMVLYKASQNLYPGTRLKIAHSISKGYFGKLIGRSPKYPADENGNIFITKELVAALKEEMQRIVDADIEFQRKERLTRDAITIFKNQGLDDKVTLLETIRELYTVYYKLDGLCDSYYGTLAPRTGMLNVFDLRPYKDGFLLTGFDKENPNVPPQHVTQEKMYKAFTDYIEFNNIVGVRNVGELNKTVLAGRTPLLINVAEALHDKYLSRISDEITRRYHEGGARIVLLAGPSSSGKTTTTKRLAIQLMTNLLKPQMVSLDNYFVDRDHTPHDETGDYDYESLYALDLEKFNKDLCDLLDGKEVFLPTYNFKTGSREYKGDSIRLEDRSVLLIEGIHGLNPELTAHIDEKMKFRVYVSALTTLSIDDHNWVPTTDNRLLRRIIRDYKYRGSSAEETLKRWPSVRRGEEKWIFPYQENADATFNSSLIFELGVMKNYAEEILSQVPRDVPEFGEAYRLRKFLSYFLPIEEKNIPSTSLLREFLGGSSFRY
ncbi:MAG: nucleoside kinase [Bacteroidales bacterium]|nr:nucleoside kinase [Bacteroidales bacterium]